MSLIPIEELELRWASCRALLRKHLPSAGGLLIFSRLNVYYFTGSFGSGVFWLPVEGKPVYLSRRGIKRAEIESPLTAIAPMRSYADIAAILSSCGSPLSEDVAVEKNGLSWALSESLLRNLKGRNFLSADAIIGICRGTKTRWEIAKLREAGIRHDKCLTELLPALISRSMTELEIGRILSDALFSQGHQGIIRMEKFGEEAFMGHVAIGDSGIYPSVFNGALGLRGMHPAVPYLGSSEMRWGNGEPLVIDCGFNLDGYMTDITRMYWPGPIDTVPSDIRKAFDFCRAVQAWLVERLRPGAIPGELWKHCSEWAESEGWGDGFMGLEGNKVFFIGHGIGLAVDEYPVLAKGFDEPLEEGMVIALEPKIGITDVGMIGLENTFEVTKDGGLSLTGTHDEIIPVLR